MIQATTIELTRAEGMSDECGFTVVCRNLIGRNPWETANIILSKWARTAPDNGCYDKCDFTVTFADGETYTGRYDLTRDDVQNADLGKHILDFCVYVSNPKNVPWLTDDDSRHYAHLLTAYEIMLVKDIRRAAGDALVEAAA